MQVLKEQKIEKYSVVLYVPVNSRFKAAVILKRDTPKAKFSTYQIVDSFGYYTIEQAEKAYEEKVTNITQNLQKRADEAAEKRAKNKETKASDHYKIGDIIVNSWGWEQTNIEFYKVVEVLPKTIKIRELSQDIEPGSEYSHGMACNVLPSDEFLTDGDSYSLRVTAGGRLSNPQSYYYMHKWDGKPEYNSWYY